MCSWLGHDFLEQPPPATLVARTAEAFEYWEAHSWGWGEHLSDVYSGVLLVELSALLLLGRGLPADLRARALALTRGLLALDDYFGEGPRVPQIRCYAFEASPRRQSFRAHVAPFPPEADEHWIDGRALQRFLLPPCGPLLARLGWHRLFPAAAPAGGFRATRLLGGAAAHSWIGCELRTGSLSDWPIVDGAEHATWGLSWQTFPLAFWRRDGDWGFWRVSVERDGSTRAHPALEKGSAYLANALGPGAPPPVVRTTAAQAGANWVALRAVPSFGPEGGRVSDGLWLVAGSVRPEVSRAAPGWSALTLPYAVEPVHVHHFPLRPGAPSPTLRLTSRRHWTWLVEHDTGGIATLAGPTLDLWALTTGPFPESGPEVERLPTAGGLRIRWAAAGWPEVVLAPSIP